MESKHIIITETKRPFWQLIIAALFFTVSAAILLMVIYTASFSFQGFIASIKTLSIAIFITLIGAGFSSQKKVVIDLEHSKFKPTLEIGFVKIGSWKTIKNYEYVSVFFDPSKSESELFEVNLWYDKNKHFELYTRNNFEDAITVAFGISEQLHIDLLDATIKGNYKWVDKEALKQMGNKSTT